VVAEVPRSAGGGRWVFGLLEGPVAAYERRVVVCEPDRAGTGGTGADRGEPDRAGTGGTGADRGEPDRAGTGGTGADRGDGLVRVVQEVRFRVGIPLVSWIFALPLRRLLGSLSPPSRPPWWAPPERLAHRRAVTLAALCGLSVVAGYLDNLLPATMTYAGREYHVGTTGQGLALAAVQLSSILALVLLAVADRRGRRRLLVTCSLAGAGLSALGALSPSVAALAATQVGAGALLSAQYVLLGVLVIEEMPDGARAWALALVTMCYGLGGGITLLALPLAGDGRGGWRWLYGLAVLAVPAIAACVAPLPESRRWRHDVGADRVDRPARRRLAGMSRRRLVVLGVGAVLFALFDTPAGQFQNQYLRTQRHWSAARISVAEQVTGTIGGVGTLVGGRLADTRGRRPVLAVAIGAGSALTLLQYFTAGGALYGAMTLSSLLGYAVAPALAVYGGELFPTARRSTAGGILTVLGAAGGLVGLAATGVLASTFGSLGPALALLAAGPGALVVLVLVAYPETAGRRLEELNPAVRPDPAVLPDPDC
jgi:MFS family permease